jgi:hypothetical protein
LKATADRAVVFVGDAYLSPGAQHVEAYRALAPRMQAMFLKLGVPVVSQAPGIELEADGLHWRVSSGPAVENLIDALIEKATPTMAFGNSKPPMLWDWKFNPTFQRHYPRCVVCSTMLDDAHLDSKPHLRKAGGTKLSFDFPGRLQHCAHGVQFRTGGVSGGPVDITPYLPSDHPLPVANHNVHGLRIGQIASLELRQQGPIPPITPNCGLAEQCLVHITWDPNEGSIDTRPSSSGWYLHIASGMARDAFAAVDKHVLLKMQIIGSGITNRNRQEWDAYLTSSSIRNIVPQVYGYTEHVIDGKQMSFLLVARVAFTFAELTMKLIYAAVSDTAVKLHSKCVVTLALHKHCVRGLCLRVRVFSRLSLHCLRSDYEAPCVYRVWR